MIAPSRSTGKGAKGTMGMDKKLLDKKKPTSRSSRAGLQFPVGRVHRLLKVMRGSLGREERCKMLTKMRPLTVACLGQWSCRCHRRCIHCCHSRCVLRLLRIPPLAKPDSTLSPLVQST